MDKPSLKALSDANTQVILEIDGVERELGITEFLQQQNPWPGDRKYKITITNVPKKKFFKDLEVGVMYHLNHDETWSLFWDIGHFFSYYNFFHKHKGKQHIYFINNIEKLDVTEGKIVIEGICSTLSSPEEGNRRYYEAHPIAYDIDNILREVDPLNFIKNSLPHYVHTDEERNKLVVKLNQTKTEEQRFTVLEMLKSGLPAGYEYNSVRENLVSKIDKIKTKEELRKLLNDILEKLFMQLKIEPEKMEILVNSLYSSLQKYKV